MKLSDSDLAKYTALLENRNEGKLFFLDNRRPFSRNIFLSDEFINAASTLSQTFNTPTRIPIDSRWYIPDFRSVPIVTENEFLASGILDISYHSYIDNILQFTAGLEISRFKELTEEEFMDEVIRSNAMTNRLLDEIEKLAITNRIRLSLNIHHTDLNFMRLNAHTSELYPVIRFDSTDDWFNKGLMGPAAVIMVGGDWRTRQISHVIPVEDTLYRSPQYLEMLKSSFIPVTDQIRAISPTYADIYDVFIKCCLSGRTVGWNTP